MLCVKITSDNQYILSGAWDKTLRFWNIANKTQIAVLKGHRSLIKSIVILDRYFISTASDLIIRVWSRKRIFNSTPDYTDSLLQKAVSIKDT